MTMLSPTPATTESPRMQMPLRILVGIGSLLLSVAACHAAQTPQTQPTTLPADASALRRVLVLTERGGQHGPFVEAASIWLKDFAAKHQFELDYVENTKTLTATSLTRYQVLIQLNYPPYAWTPEAMSAFREYIEKGKGGWVGFHHATLLGEFDGYPLWTWFSDFMGGIRYKQYIATFVAATVHVEDRDHPCMRGLSASFPVEREEWYTYNRSPRGRVRVLASVDERSYVPASSITMGDHPVVWTNEHVAARNVYIFMGHGPELLKNPSYTRLFGNAILWAAGQDVP
ncbi:MAG: ThuA domain-containing protein [Bacillota bacterium]